MNRNTFRWFFFPFSLIYGLAVGFRNLLFNLEIRSSKRYDVPVISVGNITVGGTGKTPHIEFLISTLSSRFQVAVLSRGYKRKTKGYFVVDTTSGFKEVGDEPLQLKQKFPSTVVAVDENRCHGIEQLMDASQNPFVDVVLLDDAFQHRAVHPSINILLMDYNRPIKKDLLLPAGNLRESASQMKRAQILVVTKCPADLKPMDLRILSSEIKPLPYQSLFFTTQKLGALCSLGDMQAMTLDDLRTQQNPVLLVTGIATPQNLEKMLKHYASDVQSLFFSDHHNFSKRDAKKIQSVFDGIKNKNGIIVTTEKDAIRIRQNPWMNELFSYFYYPTLEVEFLNNEAEDFKQKISNYVNVNRRNPHLS